MPSADRSSNRSSAGQTRRRVWTPDDVRALGMTTDLETAAEIIGIGRTLAYELAKNGEFPVRLLRLGRRVVVPVTELLLALGSDAANSASGPTRRGQ